LLADQSGNVGVDDCHDIILSCGGWIESRSGGVPQKVGPGIRICGITTLPAFVNVFRRDGRFL
jgi:hypothetical protein